MELFNLYDIDEFIDRYDMGHFDSEYSKDVILNELILYCKNVRLKNSEEINNLNLINEDLMEDIKDQLLEIGRLKKYH